MIDNINVSLIDPLECNVFHMKIIDKKYIKIFNQLLLVVQKNMKINL